MPRIRADIHHYLVHLGGIAEHRHYTVRYFFLDCNVCGEGRAHQFHRLFDDRNKIANMFDALTAPAEHEDLRHQIFGPLCGTGDFFQIRIFLAVGIEFFQEQIGIYEYRVENIIEVVSDPPGQCAEGFHLL